MARGTEAESLPSPSPLLTPPDKLVSASNGLYRKIISPRRFKRAAVGKRARRIHNIPRCCRRHGWLELHHNRGRGALPSTVHDWEDTKQNKTKKKKKLPNWTSACFVLFIFDRLLFWRFVFFSLRPRPRAASPRTFLL